MADQIDAFISALGRALPGDGRLQIMGAVKAMATDFRRDFTPDQFRPGLAQELASEFTEMPTYFQLQVNLKRILATQAEGPTTASEAEKWVSTFLARYHLCQTEEARKTARSVFLTYAPAEAKALARQRHPAAFPEADEAKEDMLWWWRRVQNVEAIQSPSLRLSEAIGMRGSLTRERSNGMKPHPRPQIIAALSEIIADLQQRGIEPAGLRPTPRGIHQAAPIPGHGPSGATVPDAKPPIRDGALSGAALAAARAALRKSY